MVISLIKEKKNKYYLILFLLVIISLLIISFIVWRIFFVESERILPPTVLKPPEIKINFEIFKSPILKDLEPFEEIKPIEEKVGRENPFLPY